MRNKIILVRGNAGLARHITNAEFERINADHVAMIAILKYPQLLPTYCNQLDIISIYQNLSEIIQDLQEERHLLNSEYANIILERSDVKIVEGAALSISWFFETVKSIHRNWNQIVIEARVVGQDQVLVDGHRLTIGQTIEKFTSNPPWFG